MTDATKLIDRFQTFINLVKNNSKVTLFFGNKIKYLLMKNYLWLAVDLAVNGHKKLGFKYLIKALNANRKCLLQKTFYATIKHLLY
jgi:hypothetical protein